MPTYRGKKCFSPSPLSLILNEGTHENLGHRDKSLWGGLVTVIKYNGWLLEPCQAEAWSKTMASLWTARQSGSVDWTELLSPSAALIQPLFNTGLHPNSDQHQPSDKPVHCAVHQNHKHKLWKKWLTLAWRGSLCISQYVNDENVCLLRFLLSACRATTVANIDQTILNFTIRGTVALTLVIARVKERWHCEKQRQFYYVLWISHRP